MAASLAERDSLVSRPQPQNEGADSAEDDDTEDEDTEDDDIDIELWCSLINYQFKLGR